MAGVQFRPVRPILPRVDSSIRHLTRRFVLALVALAALAFLPVPAYLLMGELAAHGVGVDDVLHLLPAVGVAGLVGVILLSRLVFRPTLREIERRVDELRAARATLEWHREQLAGQSDALALQNEELRARQDELRRVNESLSGDIAERQRVEDALRESEERYRSLVDALGEGVVLRDEHGAIEAWNRSAQQILGFGVELEDDVALDPRWTSLREDGTPLSVDEHPATITLRTGRPCDRVVVGVRRRGGEVRWLSVNTRAITVPGSDRPRGVVSTFQDVTESRATERRLELLTQLVEATPDFVGISRANGFGVYVNAAARRMTGVAADADIGRMHFQVAHPAWVTELLHREAWPALKKFGIWRGTTAVLGADGRDIPTSQVLLAHRGRDGRIEYISTVLRDVSELKATAEAALRGRDAAEAANRAKSDFLARMNHELRTPLTAIIGFTKIVLKNTAGTLSASDQALLGRVDVNARHLLDLINTVLDLAKIESGKMDTHIEPSDLAPLVRDAIVAVEAAAEAKGIPIVVEVPPRLLPASVDRMKLKQVLINLLSNAIKFTERGSVTLRVLADEAGRPRAVEVRDTGIGVPDDRRDAIFEAFEQAEASTARRFGGTGLGLPISRRFCEMMGATLTLERAAGAGSVFRVAFPAPEAVSAAA